jgi:hypothetical protein
MQGSDSEGSSQQHRVSHHGSVLGSTSGG